MRILDRYIVREILPPFVIALVVFTFVLIIPFIIEMAEQLIAKGVPWLTLLRLMATLLPQALGLTIPMALLIAILVAFGRLSSDREVVVLMACGVSPYRMLRPVMLLAILAWGATSWVMIEAIPDANQTYREITFRIVADRAEGQVSARQFFEDFPDTVLYVHEIPETGGWKEVVAADVKDQSKPVLFLARRGRVVVDREKKSVELVLEEGERHTTSSTEPDTYEVVRFERMTVKRDPESVFPRQGPARGDNELSIAEHQERIAQLAGRGLPHHNNIVNIHKKFSIPIACFVFALIGVALGVTNRRDGKLASIVLGIGVIFVYYVIMFTAHSMTKGGMVPAWLAMWLPNIFLGSAGLVLLLVKTRGTDQPIRFTLPRLPWRRRGARPGTAADASAVDAAPGMILDRPRRVVVVVRIPHLDMPRPNLLDLYVSKLYVRILAMTAFAMFGLFYISTFIDRLDKLFKGQITLSTLMESMWWETPQFLYYILAIAVLLAALVTIGLLTRNSELIVMRACGISLYRTAVPLLTFAVVAIGMLFALEERVLAVTNKRAEYLKHIIRGGSPQTFGVFSRKWIVGHKGEIYHYQYFDPQHEELNALSVFEFDPATHALTRRTYATQAAYQPRTAADPAAWIARSGWVREL